MKNGLIINTLITMLFPMLGIMRNFIDGDDPGGTPADAEPTVDDETSYFLDNLTKGESTLESGKATEEEAPTEEKVGSGEETKGNEQSQKVPPEGKELSVEDELEQKLGFGETPEVKAQRLERDYAQSSKEAIRLVAREKAITEKLEAQGLKLLISEDGKEADLVPTKGYKDGFDEKALEVDLSKLDEEQVVALESGDINEIQAVFDKIIAKTKNQLARPLPTKDEAVATLSDEKIDSILSEMKDDVDLNGNKTNPGIDKNVSLIKSMLKNETIPKDMREMFHKHPREMSRWMNALVMVERSKVQASRKKSESAVQQKKETGREKSNVNVESTGTVYSKEGSSERIFLDSIVGA